MDFQQNPNRNKMLQMVGQALGTDPKTIDNDLKAGRYDTIFQKLSPDDSARLQKLLNNPALARQVLNTPQAKKVLQNVMKQTEQKK